MKHIFLAIALMLGLCTWCLPTAQAQSNKAKAAKIKKDKKKPKRKSMAGLSPVAKALAEAGYFTDTEARPKAKTYIFICSASWCGPCRALMPQIVEEYEKNMKKDKTVSLVLLCSDSTEEDAQKYIGHYDTDLPGVMHKKVKLENAPGIPGIPWCFYMTAKGELISAGAGNKVLNWKEEVKKKPAKK